MSTRFLAFSCPHVPFEDAAAIAWLHSKIQEHKPDLLVHLGDGHEADAASKWENEHDTPFTLKDEFDHHNELLKSLRKSAPANCRRVFLPGNHDDNIMAAGRIDKRIRDLCDYRLHESEFRDGNWKIPCEYVYDRKRGTFRIGQVTFSHGFEAGNSSDEMQSILLGVPFGLLVSGHTHRVQHVQRAYKTKQVPLPYWYANPGCMRDMKPEYVKRKRTHQWGQAIVVGEASDLKSPRVSKEWSAHVEVFRMSDDEL